MRGLHKERYWLIHAASSCRRYSKSSDIYLIYVFEQIDNRRPCELALELDRDVFEFPARS